MVHDHSSEPQHHSSMNSSYHQPPTASFWELNTYYSPADVLIVGGGIVGMSTAVFLKKAAPELDVLVVERGTLPSGASTKNAGFTCIGSPSELLSDLKSNDQETVFSLMNQRLEGLHTLRNLLGDAAIDYIPCGGYEVFMPQDKLLFEECMDLLPELNQALPKEGKPPFCLADSELEGFGMRGVQHLIRNNLEGALNTGSMMLAMERLARKLNVRLLCGVGVKSVEEQVTSMVAQLDNGVTVPCSHLHVATNGFARQLLPELNVQPARAQVLITEPLPDLKVRGTFHLDQGFYYFRNVGNHLLLGGGRNLDISAETTTEIEVTQTIQRKLDSLLHDVLLPEKKVEIAHRWAGIMGVGQTKDIILKRLSSKLTCSVRAGGMGVAIGTAVGKQSAELIQRTL